MPPRFYIVSRDPNLCDPLCDRCLGFLPKLDDGAMRVAPWAYDLHRKKFDDAKAGCPIKGAFQIIRDHKSRTAAFPDQAHAEADQPLLAKRNRTSHGHLGP